MGKLTMKVHITNLYGMGIQSVAQIAQHMVAKIACQNLGYHELAIFNYRWNEEPLNARTARYDGILSAVGNHDIVIFQSPSWNELGWDSGLMDRLASYEDVKKIVFVHDVIPLMFEVNRQLMPQWVHYYNQADVLIVPSTKMLQVLQQAGVNVKKVVIQQMWDHLTTVDPLIQPGNRRVINFAGNPQKFTFVRDWNYPTVQLRLFAPAQAWPGQPNVRFMGWQDDSQLMTTLRQNGGFGLVWSTDPYWSKYMALNASYKLSTYLAAGIPVIINPQTPARQLIEQNHLGIVVSSLDEAVQAVADFPDDRYQAMQAAVERFAFLLRNGYFTRRVLTAAVFKALTD
jgi:hypothetical protein